VKSVVNPIRAIHGHAVARKMEIGICEPFEIAAQLPPDEFDFIEARVQTLLVPEKDEAEFERYLEAARRIGKPIRVGNSFLPASLKCVGPPVDHERLLRWAETAFRRAQRAGIDTIVLGASASRAISEGTTRADAMVQFAEFLRLLGPLAQQRGVTIAVEPLNKRECNFINTLAEGAEAVEMCNHPHVRMLADIYHMLVENEPASELSRFAHLVCHVHVAELAGRKFPGCAREDFRPFFHALKASGYRGGISVECKWDDIESQFAPSMRYLRAQLAETAIE
jgi:sugar phosphate isomerase/epimerase